MTDKKNIYVLGVGGVGGYFGGKMARAFSAQHNRESAFNVSFIARGTHLQEIKKHGLTLNTVEEKRIICQPAYATDTVADLPDPDICFICVKSYDLDSLMHRLKEKVKKGTVIIPLLNGVDIYDRVKSIIDEAIVLPACVYIATSVERPGVVTQQGGNCTILLGRDPCNLSYDPTPLFDLFNRSGIKFEWYDDPFPEIWTKFIFIASLGMVTASSKKTFGQIMESPELKNNAHSIMNEIYTIAVKKGVNLPSDIVSLSLEKAGNFPYDTMTSLQRDFALSPARHEGDIFGGTVIRLGRELGVPTPATESIYEKLAVS
jgi:2-dehydropantoate 2-reductase